MRALALFAVLAFSSCSTSPSPPTSCVSSRECSAQRLVCDPIAMRCVDCLSDLDCLEDGTVCVEERCEQVQPCQSARQCPGRVCDTDLGRCVDCVTNVDCASDEICDAEHVCAPAPVPCASDRECTARMQVCNAALGQCADCESDVDCVMGGTCGADGACH